jgi:hypothetical protein
MKFIKSYDLLLASLAILSLFLFFAFSGVGR